MHETRAPRDRQPSAQAASVVLSAASSRTLLPVPCPDCGLTNAGERKFCAGCGRALWEACLSCGTINGATEKFCGTCGSNVARLLQEQFDKFEMLLADAAGLQSMYRHGEAITQLQRVQASEHPRLAPFTRTCRERAQELQTEIDRLLSQRQEHFADAQQCFAQRQYSEAAAALERIPQPLREPAMQELLQQVQGILEELHALDKAIREALDERRTQGLLPTVQRYLELKPDDPAMRELAQKLETLQQRQLEVRRNQLLNAAKQKVAEHEYAMAAGLVAQIHPTMRTPEVEKFFEYCTNRADEVAWLVEDLRDFAVFDEHLLPLAERLQKLRPNDESAARLANRIRRLNEQHAAAQNGKVRHCVPSTGPSQFGWSIEMLEGFQRIDNRAIRATAAYTQNNTSFYVACGLALQGLGKAAMAINLLPEQKKSLLGSLATSVLKKRPKAAWGIDLGTYGLKAIKLGFEEEKEKEKDNEPKVLALTCEYIPYSQPLGSTGSPETLIREALDEFLKRNKIQDEAVCVSYPAAKTLARFLTLPPSDKKKLPDLMKYEARQQIPFPLESVTWDYEVTWSSDDGALQDHEVSLFALKTDEAAQHLFPLQELKLKVDVLQAEHLALHNFLAFDYYAAFQQQFQSDDELPRNQVLAVLDIGAGFCNLLLGNQHSLWVRNIPLGSQHFHRPLVTEFKLTQEQAEQLKRKPTMAAFTSKPYRAMDPLFRDLQSELRRSISSFEHTYRQRRIKQMLVVGGGARMHGLLRLLRS